MGEASVGAFDPTHDRKKDEPEEVNRGPVTMGNEGR